MAVATLAIVSMLLWSSIIFAGPDRLLRVRDRTHHHMPVLPRDFFSEIDRVLEWIRPPHQPARLAENELLLFSLDRIR